jgi:hypothetical protein
LTANVGEKETALSDMKVTTYRSHMLAWGVPQLNVGALHLHVVETIARSQRTFDRIPRFFALPHSLIPVRLRC